MSIIATIERHRRAKGDGRDRGTLIDPRIEARRQAVVIDRRARRKRRLLVVVLALTAVAALYLVTRSAALDVDTVTVTGQRQTGVDEIRAASGVRIGDHLTDLDLDAARSGIARLPWIADVSIDRSWKGVVEIAVTERVPVVALATVDPPGWLLVDADRRVLGPLAATPTELPTIEGVSTVPAGHQLDRRASAAIEVARALTPGLRSRVATVRVSGDGLVELAVRPAGTVRLGTVEGLAQKVQSLQTFFGQVDLRCLASVDMRVPDAPVLTRDRTCA